MDFKDILRELRTTAGLTQQELSDKLNVTHSTISKYERGDLEPNNTSLKRLADFFDVSADYLLGLSKEKTQQDERITQAIGADEELLEFWKVLKEREDLKLMLKQTKDLPESDIKTIFRIIKSFEEENQN